MQIISIETCQKKKKKQKESVEEIDIEKYGLTEKKWKNAKYKNHNKGSQKKLLCIILQIKKFQEMMQKISIKTC